MVCVQRDRVLVRGLSRTLFRCYEQTHTKCIPLFFCDSVDWPNFVFANVRFFDPLPHARTNLGTSIIFCCDFVLRFFFFLRGYGKGSTILLYGIHIIAYVCEYFGPIHRNIKHCNIITLQKIYPNCRIMYLQIIVT